MAKRAKKGEALLVHLIDKTIGMEGNVDLLMCGDLVKDHADDQCVDPSDNEMLTVCDKADEEGRMCLDCKRGVTFYAKGVHKGKVEARLDLLSGLDGTLEGVQAHGTTH